MPSKSWELAIGGRRIEVSIGNLAIYTARAALIRPSIPVMLDVGTDRKNPLDDPTYIGNRHARIPGERYDAFIDAYIRTVSPSGHSGEGSP